MRRALALAPALIVAATILDPAAVRADDDAAPRSLFGRPVAARRALTPDEIEARRRALRERVEAEGWVIAGDVIAPPERFAPAPPPGFPAAPAGWEYAPHRHTVFLNFFGGEMSSGTNASLMQSGCITGKVTYPGYGGSESKALAVIQTFTSKLEPFGVRVAYEAAPPPELPYSMVMIGGSPEDVGMDPGTLGVSCSSDCGDRWWRDTTLAFSEAAFSANTLAFTALQEASHAFGLDHIDGSQHIMYPYDSAGDHNWGDGCVAYNDATGPIGCTYVHDLWCGDGAQDDVAELLAYFGANTPDTAPPTVTIASPADGLTLPAGGSVDVTAEVQDDHEGVGWKVIFYKDDALVDERPSFKGETTWSLSKLSAGVYRVRVEAVDHDRNVGADEITIYVGVPAPDTGTTGGESESDGAGTDASGTGEDASGTGGAGTGDDASGTGGGAAMEEGCACDAGGRPGRAIGLAALVVLVAGARRRRA